MLVMFTHKDKEPFDLSYDGTWTAVTDSPMAHAVVSYLGLCLPAPGRHEPIANWLEGVMWEFIQQGWQVEVSGENAGADLDLT